jgi:hypothetical protein
MRKLLLATIAGAGVLFAAASSHAALILTFGQIGSGPTVTATDDGSSTTISADAQSNVTQIFGSSAPSQPVFFDLLANSFGTAFTVPGTSFVTQHFTGAFCITSVDGCGGTNYLSGSFTDSVFGAGNSLTLSVSQPPDTLTLTSDVIAPGILATNTGMSLAFAGVSPQVHEDVNTLAGFTAGVSGDFSSEEVPVNTIEPGSLAVLGSGLILAGMVGMRRHRHDDVA